MFVSCLLHRTSIFKPGPLSWACGQVKFFLLWWALVEEGEKAEEVQRWEGVGGNPSAARAQARLRAALHSHLSGASSGPIPLPPPRRRGCRAAPPPSPSESEGFFLLKSAREKSRAFQLNCRNLDPSRPQLRPSLAPLKRPRSVSLQSRHALLHEGMCAWVTATRLTGCPAPSGELPPIETDAQPWITGLRPAAPSGVPTLDSALCPLYFKRNT